MQVDVTKEPTLDSLVVCQLEPGTVVFLDTSVAKSGEKSVKGPQGTVARYNVLSQTAKWAVGDGWVTAAKLGTVRGGRQRVVKYKDKGVRST